MGVTFPDWRQDVLAAVRFLASGAPQVGMNAGDGAAPDLTNAVHWLIDDTFWDLHDPAESIGRILRHQEEATAIHRLVTAVLVVAERQGRESPDATWYGDPDWHQVRTLAMEALSVLSR